MHAYTYSSLFLPSLVMQCSPKYNVIECRLFEYWACLFFCASFDIPNDFSIKSLPAEVDESVSIDKWRMAYNSYIQSDAVKPYIRVVRSHKLE